MTLAPRSCPSSPGLAMTTRSLRTNSPIHQFTNSELYPWHFLVLAPHLAERVAHLSDRRVRSYRLENARHQILGRSSCRPQVVETPLHGVVRSEEHTSELQSLRHLVCRLL